MDFVSRILACMWFCMGIRPTVVHLLKLLHTLPRWFPQLPPLIFAVIHTPKKGGSGVVCVIAGELIPEQSNCVMHCARNITQPKELIPDYFFVRVTLLDTTVIRNARFLCLVSGSNIANHFSGHGNRRTRCDFCALRSRLTKHMLSCTFS